MIAFEAYKYLINSCVEGEDIRIEPEVKCVKTGTLVGSSLSSKAEHGEKRDSRESQASVFQLYVFFVSVCSVCQAWCLMFY